MKCVSEYTHFINLLPICGKLYIIVSCALAVLYFIPASVSSCGRIMGEVVWLYDVWFYSQMWCMCLAAVSCPTVYIRISPAAATLINVQPGPSWNTPDILVCSETVAVSACSFSICIVNIDLCLHGESWREMLWNFLQIKLNFQWILHHLETK